MCHDTFNNMTKKHRSIDFMDCEPHNLVKMLKQKRLCFKGSGYCIKLAENRYLGNPVNQAHCFQTKTA